MKRIFLLFAVVLALFCFGSVALAEGFTVSGDLMLATPNESANTDDLGHLTINGSYDLDPFVLGGSLLMCVYKDPPLADTQKALSFFYGIYGGYNIVNGESFKLAGLVGYYFYKNDYTDDVGPVEINWAASSPVVGVQAALNADPISVSLIYLYGVSPESTTETSFAPTQECADPGLYWYELKAAYALSDAWSIHLVYRKFSVNAVLFEGGFYEEDAGSAGFGAGVTYKF